MVLSGKIHDIEPHLPRLDVQSLKVSESSFVKLTAIGTLIVSKLDNCKWGVLQTQHRSVTDIDDGALQSLQRILITIVEKLSNLLQFHEDLIEFLVYGSLLRLQQRNLAQQQAKR